LKPSSLEFALQLHFSALHIDLHDDGSVRQIQPSRKQNACLAESVVVALQAREHKVRLFPGNRSRQHCCRTERI